MDQDYSNQDYQILWSDFTEEIFILEFQNIGRSDQIRSDLVRRGFPYPSHSQNQRNKAELSPGQRKSLLDTSDQEQVIFDLWWSFFTFDNIILFHSYKFHHGNAKKKKIKKNLGPYTIKLGPIHSKWGI